MAADDGMRRTARATLASALSLTLLTTLSVAEPSGQAVDRLRLRLGPDGAPGPGARAAVAQDLRAARRRIDRTQGIGTGHDRTVLRRLGRRLEAAPGSEPAFGTGPRPRRRGSSLIGIEIPEVELGPEALDRE